MLDGRQGGRHKLIGEAVWERCDNRVDAVGQELQSADTLANGVAVGQQVIEDIVDRGADIAIYAQ